jgi:hypothetical protein
LTLHFIDGTIGAGGINLGAEYQLNFNEMQAMGEDDCIKVNTKLNLVEGYANGKKSGNIYNQFITEGYFFKIPVTTEVDSPLTLNIVGANTTGASIDYNYIYF